MIFAVIFSFYTNNFLIKQRKKEFGLYNVLGLGKREIVFVVFWELFYSFLISLAAGLISGLLFARLGFLILKKILAVGEFFVFKLSFESIGLVILYFMFVLTYCKSAKPIHFNYCREASVMKKNHEQKVFWHY